MTIQELINKMKGGFRYEESPDEDRLTFINNKEEVVTSRLKEYNIWYEGDGDELLNYYTYNNAIEYNYEPFYSKNKQNYFWAISTTEGDIKRSHSGQPRNIVDTLVSIIKFPLLKAGALGEAEDAVNINLDKIIESTGMRDIYKQEQLPLTLVEGWGCYKINWDMDFSDYPILVYYRAENVDFIYKYKKIVGVIFKDYYMNGTQRYLLTETRRIKYNNETHTRICVIEKRLFRVHKDGQSVTECKLSELPQLGDTEARLEIANVDVLLAVPCILFKDTSKVGGYGRSIFTGKIDLFDDLDQCLSQASNSVRKSTPVEYFNIEYLERDSDGMPKQPHAYDRKYTLYKGGKDAEGGTIGNGDPVQVTQPQVNFMQYSDQAVQILMQIINGIMSPATLGIDISKKDNAEAQREKEKVTIFTRNNIIESEIGILRQVCSQLLVAYELMRTGKITVKEYDVSVKFSEFADDSYETKLEKLGAAYDSQNISVDMYMSKLYGDTLNRADYEKELKWLKENHDEPRLQGSAYAQFGEMANEQQSEDVQ